MLTPEIMTEMMQSRREIAITMIQGKGKRLMVRNDGCRNSVERDIETALAEAEAVKRAMITCYHNHPEGNGPSTADIINHAEYRSMVEGHGFRWGGGYVVMPDGKIAKIPDL